MEDVQFTQRTVGSTFSPIPTTPPYQPSSIFPRRTKPNLASPTPPSVLSHTPSPSSPAHECEYCFIVVCETCKDADIAAREAESKRRQKEYDEQAAREEEVRQATRQAEEREDVGQAGEADIPAVEDPTVQDPASVLLGRRPTYAHPISVAVLDQAAGRRLLLADLGLP